MRTLVVVLCAALSAAHCRNEGAFSGVITDDRCANGDHAGMAMGPTDADCTRACVLAHGAAYVLYDGRDAYVLSDQQMPEAYAGQRVTVVGRLDRRSGTLQVRSISRRP